MLLSASQRNAAVLPGAATRMSCGKCSLPGSARHTCSFQLHNTMLLCCLAMQHACPVASAACQGVQRHTCSFRLHNAMLLHLLPQVLPARVCKGAHGPFGFTTQNICAACVRDVTRTSCRRCCLPGLAGLLHCRPWDSCLFLCTSEVSDWAQHCLLAAQMLVLVSSSHRTPCCTSTAGACPSWQPALLGCAGPTWSATAGAAPTSDGRPLPPPQTSATLLSAPT